NNALHAEDVNFEYALPVFRGKGFLIAHKAKKAGTIVNISSLLGRMTVPFYGPYNASKWALEAMSENYRTELSQLGIDVVIVEPGGFATSFIDALMRPSDSARDADYTSFQPTPQFFLENFEQGLASNPEQDPANVAKAIVSLLEMPAGERPLRTIVDKMGMGDHLANLNNASDQITRGIYGAFQIDHLLDLKK
ncbi:MAG: SDR family NAD(P)-dependent oxidoreductase, partial [Calditrichota bacterium]